MQHFSFIQRYVTLFLGALMLFILQPCQAQTTYCVDLDICNTGISNEGTGNEITVIFYANGEYCGKDTKKGVKENCLAPDATFEAKSNRGRRPTSFKIMTNGEDGLFIDQITCYIRNPVHDRLKPTGIKNPNREKVGEYGIDNGTGWCLSTDPNDANGEWRGKCRNGCTSSMEFKFRNLNKPKKNSIKLDICHSSLDNEGTKNQIKVEFLRGNTVVKTQIKDGVSSNCYSFDEEFSCWTAEFITAARISTNGDDGFYIDEVSMFKDGEKTRQHGGNDGNGWCLSTDPTDAHRSWKGKCSGTGNSCWKSATFEF